MKIKQEKKFTLPKLIEWAMANDVRDRKFRSKNGYYVGFDRNGFICFDNSRIIPLDQTFTFEVEEEITEYTMFNYLLLTYKTYDDKIETHYYEDRFIKSVLKQSNRLMYVSEQLSITYFDDKGIPHLIWTHEKGMVK